MNRTSESTSTTSALVETWIAPAIRLFLTRRGRLSRSAFWWSTLVAWLTFWICFALLDGRAGVDLTRIPAVLLLYSLLCLCAKRYHDLDRSSARLTLALVPLLGLVMIIWELGFRRGTVGENGYGIDPRELQQRRDYATV